MYYKARMACPGIFTPGYDPVLGRFAQADSIVPGAGNPIAWDRYAYVSNNPLTLIDPSGHMEIKEGDMPFCTTNNCKTIQKQIASAKIAESLRQRCSPTVVHTNDTYITSADISTYYYLGFVTQTTGYQLHQAMLATQAEESWTGSGMPFGEARIVSGMAGSQTAGLVIGNLSGTVNDSIHGILGIPASRDVIWSVIQIQETDNSEYITGLGIINGTPNPLTGNVLSLVYGMNDAISVDLPISWVSPQDMVVYKIPSGIPLPDQALLGLYSVDGALPSSGSNHYPSIIFNFGY